MSPPPAEDPTGPHDANAARLEAMAAKLDAINSMVEQIRGALTFAKWSAGVALALFCVSFAWALATRSRDSETLHRLDAQMEQVRADLQGQQRQLDWLRAENGGG